MTRSILFDWPLRLNQYSPRKPGEKIALIIHITSVHGQCGQFSQLQYLEVVFLPTIQLLIRNLRTLELLLA